MKQTLKILGGALVVVCVLVVCIYGAGEALLPPAVTSAMNSIDDFHALEEDSVEVLAFGSSHAWNGVDPAVMYREYGVGAYNYGCIWQSINTTSLFVKDALKTQSPQVLLVETFNAWTPLEYVDPNGEIYYTRALANDENKWGYLRQCFGQDRIDRYLSYYVPLFGLHDNWPQMNFDNIGRKGTGAYQQMLGFSPLNDVKPVVIQDYWDFDVHPLPPSGLACLDQIVEAAYDKGAEVVFFTLPYEGVYHYVDAMQEYADMNGCYYLNFFELFEDAGLDAETDFADGGHLNAQGAAKVSAYLAEFLVDYYDLTDYRELEGTLWNQVVELPEGWDAEDAWADEESWDEEEW